MSGAEAYDLAVAVFNSRNHGDGEFVSPRLAFGASIVTNCLSCLDSSQP